jgi:hypothetical protein
LLLLFVVRVDEAGDRNIVADADAVPPPPPLFIVDEVMV